MALLGVGLNFGMLLSSFCDCCCCIIPWVWFNICGDFNYVMNIYIFLFLCYEYIHFFLIPSFNFLFFIYLSNESATKSNFICLRFFFSLSINFQINLIPKTTEEKHPSTVKANKRYIVVYLAVESRIFIKQAITVQVVWVEEQQEGRRMGGCGQFVTSPKASRAQVGRGVGRALHSSAEASIPVSFHILLSTAVDEYWLCVERFD